MKQPFILLNLLICFIACQSNQESKSETSKIIENLEPAPDTIIYSTSSDETIYIGNRILPQTQISDSMTISFLKNSEITTAIEVGDSIFIFLNNDMLVSEANDYFPQINDSLIQYHYSKIYDVEIDDDLPYFAYLKSKKDNLVFVKDKDTGEFTWSGVVTDTIMNFMYGIKIGTTKKTILEKFKIANTNKSPDLTIILDHASIPSKIWYNSYLPELGNYQYPTTTMLLRIENDILTGILIDPWISYGRADDLFVEHLNEN